MRSGNYSFKSEHVLLQEAFVWPNIYKKTISAVQISFAQESTEKLTARLKDRRARTWKSDTSNKAIYPLKGKVCHTPPGVKADAHFPSLGHKSIYGRCDATPDVRLPSLPQGITGRIFTEIILLDDRSKCVRTTWPRFS